MSTNVNKVFADVLQTLKTQKTGRLRGEPKELFVPSKRIWLKVQVTRITPEQATKSNMPLADDDETAR